MSDWTDAQNDVLVKAYFAMLAKELKGEPFVKAQVNRDLQARTGRARGAVEYKLQNVSAVLLGLGRPWIHGYKPAQKFQRSLVLAVLRALDADGIMPAPQSTEIWQFTDLAIAAAPPSMSPDFSARATESRRRVTAVVDVAAREMRNRRLGMFGERLVFEAERRTLAAVGRDDLASKVKWVARDEGDGHGYDVASFTVDGADRHLEVKTTSGWAFTPFFISENERRVGEKTPESWRIVRVWDAARAAKAFEIAPPLATAVDLSPTAYRARFHAAPPPSTPL